MDENLRQKIALFRYSLIAPIIAGTVSQDTVKEYLQDICAKKYETPDGSSKEFAPATIKEWLHKYRLYGIEVFILRIDAIKVNQGRYLRS